MHLEPTALRFATRDGIELQVFRYRAQSESEDAARVPLIFLHGGGANAYWWDHIARPLARRFAAEATLFALDFRGHGDSAFPENREVGAFGDDLEALVAWLGREDVILVGHSMGAAVALDHASRFPATRGVVLVDPARGRSKGSRRRARLALAFRRTYPTREDAIARYQFLPESSHASEALRESIATHSVGEEPDGRFGYKFDPAWFALPSKPPPVLADVACPVRLIRGMESGLINDEAAGDLISALPDAEDHAITDAGHHVMLDQPEAFRGHLEQVLPRLIEGSPRKRDQDR